MVDEKKIRNSFSSLKKDIEKLNSVLSGVANKIEELQKALPEKILDATEEKIFTSKVFVNNKMKKTVVGVLESGWFSNGEKCKEFEKKFSEYCGAKHAIAVSNGTVAIEIVLRTLGIKNGDEIIVPSHTTMPSVEPILHVGATPVFVDINLETYNIDENKIEKAITKKTKAVLPVHLYGNPAEIEKIKNICEKNKLLLIEDCAQANGSRFNGKPVGTFGIAGCFSFYPTKNLTVCGEGGMIITDDDKLARKARVLINHGEDGRYNHIMLGHNYRLGEIHCAIGIEQLKLLDWFIERRRQIAKLYDECLENSDLILPKETGAGKHSYHLYVVRTSASKRNKIIEKLKNENIYLGIHYPIPVHKQKIIGELMNVPVLKNTEKACKEIISLPVYPTLKDEEVIMIAQKIKEVMG